VHIDGEAARMVVESVGYTVKVGTCPVCAAVEAVIEKESNPIVIRAFERNLAPAANPPRPRGQRPNAGIDRRNPIRHGITPEAQQQPPVMERKRKHKKKSTCSLM